MNHLLSILLALSAASSMAAAPAAQTKPNILWLTSEDNGPQLGCYGDPYATTPNLDALAAKGMLYLHAWSTAPVCAPARTAIISGIYPPSTGAEHMRSLTRLPAHMRMFPQYLRQAGYYCSNNSKEDYNLEKPGQVWDESSNTAHWKNRKPGQPFFAVFNHTISHESQIRTRPHEAVHDPAKVRVPAFHPDVPEVRRDWAQYYDKVTEMDAAVGARLKELEEAGLAEDTIIFYFGDHGSGMPRHKRWPYNSGLRVPLIVYVPAAYRNLAPGDYQEGGRSERLVDFVDLAPTMLSLARLAPPKWMDGHALMGLFRDKPRSYLYGFRGRMDERYDLVRSVRDQRYVYIRNYMPHKIYGQHVDYMFQTPTTRVWKQLYDDGKLAAPQSTFWESKPTEELYDLQSDPDEVQNLVYSPAHQKELKRLRKAHQKWELQTRDVGFLPEDEIHHRSEASSPYEIGHRNSSYPMKSVLSMAQLASERNSSSLPKLRSGLEHRYSAVRYWAALGLLMQGTNDMEASRSPLRQALEDPSPSVRVIAAEALAKFGSGQDFDLAMPVLLNGADLNHHSLYVVLLALNAIDDLDDRPRQWQARIQALPKTEPGLSARLNGYVPRLLEKIQADLEPAQR